MEAWGHLFAIPWTSPYPRVEESPPLWNSDEIDCKGQQGHLGNGKGSSRKHKGKIHRHIRAKALLSFIGSLLLIPILSWPWLSFLSFWVSAQCFWISLSRKWSWPELLIADLKRIEREGGRDQNNTKQKLTLIGLGQNNESILFFTANIFSHKRNKTLKNRIKL